MNKYTEKMVFFMPTENRNEILIRSAVTQHILIGSFN